MLKVLIIDDEKLVRQMVMRCIEWEELGLHIVGEASSARMGLEMIDELQPDMVFMDVRMPGMDGLTCSRQILKKHPQVKVLILSGHDEFEYASEGIRIGVFDYLLKPVNAEELKKAAVKARDAILAERDHRQEFERYKEELEKHASYIRDRQLSGLVRSRTPEAYMESLGYFGVKIENGVFQAALVELGAGAEEAGEEERLLAKMHARRIMEDYYGETAGIYVIDSGADWLILLNNASETAVYDQAEELREYLENNMETSVCIGVGNVYSEIEKLHDSYQEAKDALNHRFVSGEEGVICFCDVYPFYDTEQAAVLNDEVLREFGNAVRISDAHKAEKLLEPVLDHMKKTGKGREGTVIFAVQILAGLMQVLTELKLDSAVNGVTYPELIAHIFSLATFEDIREYLRELVESVCAMIGEEVSDKEKTLVHKVKDYLEEHYMDEELSLNFLAGMFYVNASYLSRVFKEKTGATFSSYLFDVRMGAAEELVRSTELKAYEIAERVGIADPHYFSACFKKYTGMSVSDYKQGKNF